MTARSKVLADAFALSLVVCACDREVFQHQRAALVVDAGGAAGEQCEGKDDGTPCDDHSVCSPSSTCRAGVCEMGNSFGDCVVADSADDFSTIQGKNGFFYGYWTAGDDPDGAYDGSKDFVLMKACDDGVFRPEEVCGLTRDDPGFRWTSNLGFSLQHPETRPVLELPVRRFVSDVSGPSRVFLHHHVDGTASDGTRAILLVDGVEKWRNDARGGETVGTQVTLDVELAVGTVVEQLVHPLKSSADDTTYFEMRIEGH